MKSDTRCVDGRLMRHDPQSDDPWLETDRGQCPECDGAGCNAPKAMGVKPDPRDPDHTRSGIFVYHNCSKCGNGEKPCVNGSPGRCDYPQARND